MRTVSIRRVIDSYFLTEWLTQRRLTNKCAKYSISTFNGSVACAENNNEIGRTRRPTFHCRHYGHWSFAYVTGFCCWLSRQCNVAKCHAALRLTLHVAPINSHSSQPRVADSSQSWLLCVDCDRGTVILLACFTPVNSYKVEKYRHSFYFSCVLLYDFHNK